MICHRRHHDDDKSTGATDRQAAERFEAIVTTNVVRAKSRGANAARQRHSGARRLSARRAGIRLSTVVRASREIFGCPPICQAEMQRRRTEGPKGTQRDAHQSICNVYAKGCVLVFSSVESAPPETNILAAAPPLHLRRRDVQCGTTGIPGTEHAFASGATYWQQAPRTSMHAIE